MTLIIVEHPIQDITENTCRIYFKFILYKNLFDPDEKSSIVKNEFLNRKTIEDSMNKIFSTNTKKK